MDRFAERFWARVERKPTGCWIWTGAKNRYGNVKRNGQMLNTHRVAFELAKGPILPGFLVLHRCSEKLCVNPDHLYLGTHSDNLHDAYRQKERLPRT